MKNQIQEDHEKSEENKSIDTASTDQIDSLPSPEA